MIFTRENEENKIVWKWIVEDPEVEEVVETEEVEEETPVYISYEEQQELVDEHPEDN
jgi:hypothetical protein